MALGGMSTAVGDGSTVRSGKGVFSGWLVVWQALSPAIMRQQKSRIRGFFSMSKGLFQGQVYQKIKFSDYSLVQLAACFLVFGQQVFA